MRNTLLPLLLIVLLGLTSCEDEFDLNADYQDITVVYGLLELNTDTTFLKINKAFLGEGNTLEMAKVQDSSTYKQDLSATIEAYNGSNPVGSYFFDATEINNKEDGVFYNPNQLVYYSPMEINDDYTYRLVLQVGNKQVTAETPIVNSFSIEWPTLGSEFVKIQYNKDYNVEWFSAVNGRRYEVIIRFRFRELFEGQTDTVSRHLDWFLGTFKSVDDEGGDEMFAGFNGNNFFNWVSQFVPYDDPQKEESVVGRFTETLDFIIQVAAEDLNTYMEVNEPSSSIVQTKPEYTNIENGLGIFSSRLRQTRPKDINPETVVELKKLQPPLKFEY